MHQVIIVGAGPAGTYLAYLLARQGINVLLLEKERFPRYKPCGGGVSPKVIRLLDFDMSALIEDTIYTVVFTYRLAEPITVTADRPVVYMVSRERFDSFLLDQAKQAGVEVLEGVPVDAVEVSDSEVLVQAGERKWRGQILVGADGALSIVARTLGLAGKKRRAVTVESEVPVAVERLAVYQGTVKVDYGLVPTGYSWVFPKADHLSMGVGSISPRVRDLRSLLGKLLESERLKEFLPSRVRGWTIPISPEPRDLHLKRALVIGDAAGLADAFTGEGIYTALVSARLAAEVITEQISRPRPELHGYTRLVQEKIGRDMASAFRVTRWFYPASGLVHRLLHRHQGLATDLFQVIAGDMSYVEFFNIWRQRLRAAWPLLRP